MENVIPKTCDWLQTKVETFHPESNTVVTSDGNKVYCPVICIFIFQKIYCRGSVFLCVWGWGAFLGGGDSSPMVHPLSPV